LDTNINVAIEFVHIFEILHAHSVLSIL